MVGYLEGEGGNLLCGDELECESGQEMNLERETKNLSRHQRRGHWVQLLQMKTPAGSENGACSPEPCL